MEFLVKHNEANVPYSPYDPQAPCTPCGVGGSISHLPNTSFCMAGEVWEEEKKPPHVYPEDFVRENQNDCYVLNKGVYSNKYAPGYSITSFPKLKTKKGSYGSKYHAKVSQRYHGINSGSQGTHMSTNIDPDIYRKKDVLRSEKEISGDCSGTYYATDPRLYHMGGGTVLTLDSPPITGGVNLEDIYSKELDGYGQQYKTYKDINAGQIRYYVDEHIAQPFFTPIYTRNGYTRTNYTDPMNIAKPQYDQIYPYSIDWPEYPNGQSKGNSTPLGTLFSTQKGQKDTEYCGEDEEECLSFIKDTTFQREDITSRQRRVLNQQKWTTRWSDYM